MAAKKKPAKKKGAKKKTMKVGGAVKIKRVPLVPVRSRRGGRPQEEAPDVAIVRGPVIPATAQERAERDLDETISRLSRDVAAGKGDPGKLEAAKDSLRLLVQKRTGEKFVFPEYGFLRKADKPPCEWKIQYKKGGGKTGGKPMHKGRVELAMITNEDSEKMGLPPGPAVRLCVTANKPAPIVSVADPGDALKIAAGFRDCAKKAKTSKGVKQCGLEAIAQARGIPEASVKIAGLGRSHK